jgi:putative aminopeptidase FrvX
MPIDKLLTDLSKIKATSGDESGMHDFLIDFIDKRKQYFKVLPEVFSGENFHDCILLKFGVPRTAIFAHIDTIGFMVRYENQLIPIGGPEAESGYLLSGEDELGPISCSIIEQDGLLFHDFPRPIMRGTRLSFANSIECQEGYLVGPYLDNKLGVYNALKVCENIVNGWVVFSTYEEHGGGSMPFLLDFIQQTSPIKQALISDITWVTDGIQHEYGVTISIRDKHIPRKKFLDKVIQLANQSSIPYQLEVESGGSSDGREIQFSRHLIDWCFIGAPEDNVHSPYEKVAITDLESMIAMYEYLMEHL